MEIVNGRFVNFMIANWRFFCIIFAKKEKRAQIFLDLHPFTMLFRRCARFVYGEIKE